MEILQLQDIVSLPSNHVPQLKDISVMLERTAGFRMEPVAGLVFPRTFFNAILDKEFFWQHNIYATGSKPFYTPEPDIIHEIVVVASLAHPGIVEVNRLLRSSK